MKISNHPPSIKHANVDVIALSETEYPGKDHYQSIKDNVRIHWSGFEDYVGIEQYRVRLVIAIELNFITWLYKKCYTAQGNFQDNEGTCRLHPYISNICERVTLLDHPNFSRICKYRCDKM